MVPTPTPVSTAILFLGILIFLFIMLLPAILELKNPKDAGPRMIKDYGMLDDINMLIDSVETDEEVEKEMKFNEVIVKEVSKVLALLPNLEP